MEEDLGDQIKHIIERLKRPHQPPYTIYLSEAVYNQMIMNKPTSIKWTWRERVYFWLLIHWKWFAKRHQLKGCMIGERYK